MMTSEVAKAAHAPARAIHRADRPITELPSSISSAAVIAGIASVNNSNEIIVCPRNERKKQEVTEETESNFSSRIVLGGSALR
jgi:hypothetical protein